MSEEKPGEKSKSTLSADVPPFIPRNCNMELLSNVAPAQDRINHIPQYLQDTAHVGDSEWHVPVIPPASSGIMIFPVAPVLHSDYQFQSSQDNGYYIQTSDFSPTKKHFPSKVKKNHTRKNLEEKTVSTASETNVNNNPFSQSPHASSENETRQKETSRHWNPKLKINFVRNSGKQESHIRIMTHHKPLNSSVKLDSAEFPSLPVPSNKDKLYSQTCNSEPYQSTQYSSYSSILQSTPKHPSDLNTKPDVSISDKNMLIANRTKRISQQNMHREQKAERIPGKRHSFHGERNRFDDTVKNEQKDNLKTADAKKKECRPQTERKRVTVSRHSSANLPESVIERKKYVENNRKNSEIINASSKEGGSIMDQLCSRQSSSKDPGCSAEGEKHEGRKNNGTAVNSSKKKNSLTDKMHSRQYGANSTESVIEKKKHIENVRNNNKTIIDSSKEKSSPMNQTYLKQCNLKTPESTLEREKYAENPRKNNQVTVDCFNKESNVTSQLMKLEKSQKRKKRKRKKRKDSLGKVALLSPEVFANITNKMSKESKVNQNGNFNLCDQLDFPSLGSFPSVTTAELKTETENYNTDCVKDSEISSSSEKLLNMNASNVWRPAAHSDIVQANKAKNNEIQTDVDSTKSPSNSKNEGTLDMASKKKERKKKKKDNVTSDNSKKAQADSGKQIKCNPVIQISLTTMLTSLQQVKLNQVKKKETKARVISTKRGIMDKIANRHNILDSSAPMRKRGKEREKPGKKRLSAMRKIILRERERRRMQYLKTQKCNSEEESDVDKQVDINTNVAASSESSTNKYESSGKENGEQVDAKLQASKIILHTRKFRDYCDHMISEEIDSTVLAILKDLIRFQDRLHEKDPIKARMKRRLVYGLREVTKHLRLCKLKCIIIAPNIENIPSEGGLSDALQIIIKLAQQQNVPYIFALQRRSLGKVCMKIVPVSCVGIFNYDGAEGHYRKLLEFLLEAREKYNEILKVINTFITEDIEAQLLQPNILPAAVQPIRSKVLSKIAMHNAFTKNTITNDSKSDTGECITYWNTGDMLRRMEEISVTDQLVQDKEPIIEFEKQYSEEAINI